MRSDVVQPSPVPSRLARVWQFIRSYLFWGLLISALCLWLFQELAEEVIEGDALGFDSQVIALVQGQASDTLTAIMIFITMFGDWRVMVPLGVIVGLVWLRQRQYGRATLLATTAVGGTLMEQTLKFIFQRQRPDILGHMISVSGYSFPSGHAMISVCLYGILIYLFAYGRSLPVRVACFVGGVILFIGIGLSRIYLGVHYPSDVLAGYAAGLIWLQTNIFAYHRYRQRTTARQKSSEMEKE